MANSLSIAISAADGASAVLDRINKRVNALTVPAERANKALAKFGETSGLSRLTESVRGFGAGAADAFRSLDRMAGTVGVLTSVGSIAGMMALSRTWAQFGNTVAQVAYRLNMPVEKLGEIRGAMRLAGGNAADVDSGLKGLQDTLNNAAWGRDPKAFQLFESLGIHARDAEGHVRQAGDVLGDLADKIQNMPAATQARVLNESGLGEGFLPLLKNGRKGLESLEKQAEQTGGVMTAQMVKHATEMNKAWQQLELDIEGVGNRIVDSWSGTITKVLNNSSKWIESNKSLADDITQIGAAVSALAAIKPALWVLRLLGLDAAAAAVGTTATLAVPLALSGDTAPDYGTAPGGAFFGNNGALAHWWQQTMPTWAGGRPRAPITVPQSPSVRAAQMQRDHDYFRSKGLTEQQTAGILANIAAESNFDPNITSADGGHGLFQYTGTRWDAIRAYYHTQNPTAEQQLDYAWYELNTSKKPVLDTMNRDPNNSGLAASVWSRGFEVPAAGSAEAQRRADAAPQFVNPGHVQVDVNIKHDANGKVTAKTSSTGPVTAPPARIETPLPMVN